MTHYGQWRKKQIESGGGARLIKNLDKGKKRGKRSFIMVMYNFAKKKGGGL